MLMKKRFLSCLLVLAMLLPMSTAFAATTMADVSLIAQPGQTITLTAANFTDELTLDPADAGVTLDSIAFPTLPGATQAVIRLDSAAYVADEEVTLAELTAGDLRVEVTAARGTMVRIPFRATLSNGDTLTASLDIGVMPALTDQTHTVEAGKTVRVNLGIPQWTAGERFTLSFQGDRDLEHGTLHAIPGEHGVFEYRATSEGTDSFTFTIRIGDVTSAPTRVTLTVTPSSIQPHLNYYDMPTHWAGYSAGRLATLDKIVGHRVDNRYFFHPDRGITRGDFVVWLLSVAGIEPTDHTTTIYADTDIPTWMRGFLNAATEANIIQGAPAGSPGTTNYFFPNTAITRIEAIRMISQALGVEGHGDNLTGLFNDIAQIPNWARNNVRHLHELEIIQGDGHGNLHPRRNLSRGEAAEMLYKTHKELVLPAPPAATTPAVTIVA